MLQKVSFKNFSEKWVMIMNYQVAQLFLTLIIIKNVLLFKFLDQQISIKMISEGSCDT